MISNTAEARSYCSSRSDSDMLRVWFSCPCVPIECGVKMTALLEVCTKEKQHNCVFFCVWRNERGRDPSKIGNYWAELHSNDTEARRFSSAQTHPFPCCLTVWSPKLVQILKNSVRTAKKTLHFTITKINWLTLFKEIITVYSENHTKYINTKWKVTDY
jgi:hypothetical protein